MKKLVISTLLLAVTMYGNSYGGIVATVDSVYDGDTITVTIPGYPPIMGNKIGVRINGIDTPEIKGECAAEKKLALKAKKLMIKLVKECNGKVTLWHVQRDKYFRILADVYVKDKRVADIMIEQKLAVPYDGGTKTSWCK